MQDASKQQLAARLVKELIHYHVSPLINSLLKVTEWEYLEELMELTRSIPNYEETLKYEGFAENDGIWIHPEHGEFNIQPEEICDQLSIDPTSEVEPLEYWIVDRGLANRLTEQGEKIVEIAGLTVWARTESGQAIHLDAVIQKIALEIYT